MLIISQKENSIEEPKPKRFYCGPSQDPMKVIGCIVQDKDSANIALTFTGTGCLHKPRAVLPGPWKISWDWGPNPERIRHIRIEDGLTQLDAGIFINLPHLESVILPRTLTSISSESFSGCRKLRKINLPILLEYIGPRAFEDCISLSELRLPDGIVTIYEETFLRCHGLRRISFPKRLKHIQPRAFMHCDALRSVEFGEYLEDIRSQAFAQCHDLQRIDLSRSNVLRRLDPSSFDGCENAEELLVCTRQLNIVSRVWSESHKERIDTSVENTQDTFLWHSNIHRRRNTT